jgi:glutathione peroxidase
MFQKVQVTGTDATPLYQRLTAATGVAPGWNFHKYLDDRQGKRDKAFDSGTAPNSSKLTQALEAALKS